MRRYRFRLGWLAVAALLLMAAPSTAQQICLQLESQLAALDRGGNQQAYQQLLAQYQTERANYDAAYYRVQQAGCAVLFRRLAPPVSWRSWVRRAAVPSFSVRKASNRAGQSFIVVCIIVTSRRGRADTSTRMVTGGCSTTQAKSGRRRPGDGST